MNLTKFGISTALISALAFVTGYYSIVGVAILFVFVLYTECDETLKINVTQAFVFTCIISLLCTLLSSVSGGYMDIISKIANIDTYNYNSTFYNVAKWFDVSGYAIKIIHILEYVVAAIAFFVSLSGKQFKIPGIYGLVAKHFGKAKDSKPQTEEVKAVEANNQNNAQ